MTAGELVRIVHSIIYLDQLLFIYPVMQLELSRSVHQSQNFTTSHYHVRKHEIKTITFSVIIRKSSGHLIIIYLSTQSELSHSMLQTENVEHFVIIYVNMASELSHVQCIIQNIFRTSHYDLRKYGIQTFTFTQSCFFPISR